MLANGMHQGAALLSIVLGRDVPADIVYNVGKSILSPEKSDILDEAGYFTVKHVISDFIVSNYQENSLVIFADTHQAIT